MAGNGDYGLLARSTARVARVSTRFRRVVITLWLIAFVGSVSSAIVFGGHASNDFGVPGSDSAAALETAEEVDPRLAGTNAIIVFAANDDITQRKYVEAVTHSLAELRSAPDVFSVSDPYATEGVSRDRRAAIADVGYAASVHELTLDDVDRLRASMQVAVESGLVVEFGGQLLVETAKRGSVWAEAVGFGVALVVLVAVFGNFVAAGICLVVAAIAIGTGISLLSTLSAWTTVPTTASTLATMIGLGVAIDYALFYVSRYRSEVTGGSEVDVALERASAVAGRSVAVAGLTVVLALAGLTLAGLPPVSFMAYASSLTVLLAVLASLTLLPALLATTGSRAISVMPSLANLAAGQSATVRRWSRWTHHVTERPWRYLAFALATIFLLSSPIAFMRLGQLDAGVDPTSHTQRRAYDIIAAKFTAGANDPLLVTYTGAGGNPRAELFRQEVQTDSDVASATIIARSETTSVLHVVPVAAGRSTRTADLVDRLRSMSTAESPVRVGGANAAYVDFTKRIDERLMLVVGVTIALSFVALLISFRAPVVAAKSAVLNGFSIAASLGVIVAVFQLAWDWPIPSFMPILVFALVFGLSMDYEVFILSRVREDYLESTDDDDANQRSIVSGVASSAQVIAPAALIMIAVFAGFALDPDGNIRVIGVALSVAILIDATLIRLVVIPSTMMLLGRLNWWPAVPGGTASKTGVVALLE